MREDDINLIQKHGPIKKNEKTFEGLGIGIFAVVFIVGMLFLFYSFFLSTKSNSLNSVIDDIRAQIEKSAVKKQKLLITSERLSAIRMILAQRNGVEKTASLIYSIFPDTFSVDSLGADGQQITIAVEGSSLADFANLLTITVPSFINKHKSLITSVTIDTFAQGKGSYNLSLTFNVKEGEK